MPKLGMNLRVTSDSKQGGRKYMEDVVCVEFHKGDDGETIEFVYFAVFDGHGGKEAACFAKEHLLKEITKHRGFWSDDDRQVLKAITDGFISTHKLMWRDVGKSTELRFILSEKPDKNKLDKGEVVTLGRLSSLVNSESEFRASSASDPVPDPIA